MAFVESILASTADVPAPVRGAALLGLVVVGGLLGLTVIVVLAWRCRRWANRGTVVSTPVVGPATDPWREAARRVQIDPEDDEPGPAMDLRDPSA
jgi:hypothetical protein